MAPDDDERGIDWLASQLDDPASEAPLAETAGTETAGTETAGTETADAAASDPWWTTPLPQPAPSAPATELADPIVPATGEPDSLAADRDVDVDVDVAIDRDQAADPMPENLSPAVIEPEPSLVVLPAAAPTSAAPTAATLTFATRALAAPPNRHRSRRGASGVSQAALVWTAVGLLAIIVLVGLFYLGQRLVARPAPVAAPTTSASATPTPTPIPAPEITAMQPAGVHQWNALFGGECLEPYVSPWEEEFTVVDCAAAHTSQLVYRGSFGGDASTAFPGEAALAAQINLLCTAPGILDLTAAGAYPNLQMQGSYPITAEQWTAEPRNYYCFVTRASAEPLTASISGTGPTA
ncbi:hypothetical protein [Cryobacterium sp. PH31-O1]|uniref:hypothetical protein n=1 Tax=Cryobacterium sp. PH31-O1 TaxID=3046306 RepID=UPI0024B89D44|nr:hypothetical protein [Cryobacterium sp. PH31-O1]MDJ0339683.1 hypothetical protein [Cryobacterium sp. PH31-O1]